MLLKHFPWLCHRSFGPTTRFRADGGVLPSAAPKNRKKIGHCLGATAALPFRPSLALIDFSERDSWPDKRFGRWDQTAICKVTREKAIYMGTKLYTQPR